MTAPSTPERRNFYGRVHGKTLRQSQKTYLAEDLDRFRLRGVTVEENPGRAMLDLAGLARGRPVWLEVGFGGGEHLVHQAARNPDAFLIGAEPFVNGIAMCLGKLRAGEAGNVAIHPGDVRDLLDVLPGGGVAKAFLNYPDPWPKARHHRRRFVTPGYLGALARVMRAGAEFRVATDIPDYVRQTLDEVPRAGFDLVAGGGVAWDDWLSTRYEQKALREGRVPHYLTFRRAGAL
ncbi:MAG: tRNA (guanine(46)-N(7))-methyltransferase TrmB [Paracoccaceae bacterium]|nr:MAG: tRNA (guanine(46)-N(7))-methyltransferase TrmB [Paracoccaceae bacterium]